jgi:hypothetical protein
MFTTIKNPIHHEAGFFTLAGSRTPRAHLYRSGITPYVAIRQRPTVDVKLRRGLLKKIGSVILPDAVAALSAIALVLSVSVYMIVHISSHHQHAHNYAMTPIKSVETRVVDRSSILPMPGSGRAGNIKTAQR